MTDVQIKYVKNLHPVFTKPKRIKIIVGGRGSTKSTGIADYVAANVYNGQLWCCARENQNSIEESVHRTLLDEIDRLELGGFSDTKTSITHESGGRTFYRGLARNITSLKSTLSGIDGLWIEEGEDISENTLRVLTASVRLNAKDTERLNAGEDVKMPEIIITMNRGARNGAVAKKWLARAEKHLEHNGYYEDEAVMIVQMNYTDMPKSWFEGSGLEVERLDDLAKLSTAQYEHKWLGKYLDEVENSIIKPEWFDACVDAHKSDRLKDVFDSCDAIMAAHDPADGGNDDAGFAVRQGSIIKAVKSMSGCEVDKYCDWAIAQAKYYNADWFVWDGDGLGAGLKRQVSNSFSNTNVNLHMFKGSLSGAGQDNAELIYQEVEGRKDDIEKTYADTFKNNRSQYYINLANRMYNTYKCVVNNAYINPDNMISFDSDGIEDILELRSQICRIPRKLNDDVIQIMSKKDMKSKGIESPNEVDSIVMTLYEPPIEPEWEDIEYEPIGIV